MTSAPPGPLPVGLLFGSFDPVTIGHIGLVRQALDGGIVSRLIVLVREKRAKSHLLTRENASALFRLSLDRRWSERVEFRISRARFIRIPREASLCLRGARSAGDSDYERTVRRNTIVGSLIGLRRPLPTLILPPDDPRHRAISSTAVRAALMARDPHLETIAAMVPAPAADLLAAARRKVDGALTGKGAAAFNESLRALLEA